MYTTITITVVCLHLQTQSYDITGLAPYQLVTVTITVTNDGNRISEPSNTLENRTREASMYRIMYALSYIML